MKKDKSMRNIDYFKEYSNAYKIMMNMIRKEEPDTETFKALMYSLVALESKINEWRKWYEV